MAAVIVAGLAFQFWRSDPRALDALRIPAPGLLAAALVMGTASYLLLLDAWRFLRGLRESWRDVGGVWFASLFARYAPGAVWQGAIRIGGAHFAGESKRVVLERYLAEQALACFSATTVSLALIVLAHVPVAAWLIGALVLVATAALASTFIGPRFGAALQWPLSAVLSVFVAHASMGLGFVALVSSLTAMTSAPDAAAYVVMFFVAAIAGLLAIFVPAGLGVREAVLAGMLTPSFGAAPAIAIAIAARGWLLACEGLAFALWWIATRRVRNRAA
ncbi:MAG TPA: hypothetical protein VJX31_12665 [Casimicrobiaceae bacterium]|nr:hypothetical protein [Casimicrobiaceae bacterium]